MKDSVARDVRLVLLGICIGMGIAIIITLVARSL